MAFSLCVVYPLLNPQKRNSRNSLKKRGKSISISLSYRLYRLLTPQLEPSTLANIAFTLPLPCLPHAPPHNLASSLIIIINPLEESTSTHLHLPDMLEMMFLSDSSCRTQEHSLLRFFFRWLSLLPSDATVFGFVSAFSFGFGFISCPCPGSCPPERSWHERCSSALFFWKLEMLAILRYSPLSWRLVFPGLKCSWGC